MGDKKQHVEENTVSNFTKHQQMMVFSFLFESERRSGHMEVNVMLQLRITYTVQFLSGHRHT